MKVLGIITEMTQIRYIMVAGSNGAPNRESEKLCTLAYPAAIESGAALANMLKTLTSLITALQPDKTVVLQSVPARMGKPSATRPVIEALIKLACNSANQECLILHPNSLRAKEKKFESCTGQSPEGIFNSGQNFSPSVSRDAHLVAWAGLEQ